MAQLKLAFIQGFQKLAYNTLDRVRLILEMKHNIFSDKFNEKLKYEKVGLEEDEEQKYAQIQKLKMVE